MQWKSVVAQDREQYNKDLLRTMKLGGVTHGEWNAFRVNIRWVNGIQHVVEFGNLAIGIGNLFLRNPHNQVHDWDRY